MAFYGQTSKYAKRYLFKDIKEMALRSGSRLDAIIINGDLYGGSGGDESQIVTFDSETYPTHAIIHSGSYIDKFSLFFVNGLILKGGSKGGEEHLYSSNCEKLYSITVHYSDDRVYGIDLE